MYVSQASSARDRSTVILGVCGFVNECVCRRECIGGGDFGCVKRSDKYEESEAKCQERQ